MGAGAELYRFTYPITTIDMKWYFEKLETEPKRKPKKAHSLK